MDEEQGLDQEQQNNSDGFLKQQKNKGTEAIKEKGKKQVRNKIISLIKKNPKVALIILGVIAAAILIIILFAGFVYLLNYLSEKGASEAKQASISFNLAGSSATVEAGGTGTGDAGTGSSGSSSSGSSSSGSADTTEETRLTVQKTDEGNYEIVSNYTEEEFEELKNDRKLNIDIGDFSDFEKSVLYAFQENGMDLYDYTREELKCIPAFLKAEGCTQYLDLRENKDKQSGKKVGDYIDAYEPAKIEDLEENEIPGTILVQRTTTSETEPVTLQYMAETEFQELIDNNDIKAIDYFSMTDEGKLVIAKRSYKKIVVSGEYPESIPQEQREQSKEETIITKEEIEYVETIKNYVMPFDFLMQLLIITENPEFCLDLVDMVLDSKIVINIQEEETRTHKEEVRTYDVHNKENKYIEYEVGNGIEKETNVFLKETKDDENNDCTTYSTEQFKVTVVTDTTNYSYKPEIIEADTWIAHYKNEYDAPEKKVTNPEIDPQEVKEEYKQLDSIQKTGADAEADPHAAKFKAAKEAEYKAKIPAQPTVYVNEYSSLGKKYKEINISSNSFNGGGFSNPYEGQKSVDENGKEVFVYYLPAIIYAYTKDGVCPSTVTYYYSKGAGDTYAPSGNNADTVFQCKILRLAIVPYQKTNLKIETTEEITKFETDPEPKKTTRIYAKDEDGNFEKFLKIFDEHKNARKMLFSVEEWLFEMMIENGNTIKLEPILKYLLYLYDGRDRGVTDLDLSIFEPGEFKSVSISMNLAKYLRQFSHEGDAPQTDDHKFYKMYGDSIGWPTIGTADLQWASHHDKFNKEGMVLENGVEKTVPSVEAYVNAKLGGPGVKLSDSAIDSLNIYIDAKLVDEIGNEVQKTFYELVENAIGDLDLSKQQMFALVSIAYNFGHLPERNGYTFAKAYREGAAKYEINSWEHNRYIWDKWWAYIGGGSPGHIPARDAAFETYVKGVFDFSTSDAGKVFGRNYYIYYTEAQKSRYSYAPDKRITRNPSDLAHEEEIFTYVQGAFGGETLEVCEQIMNEMIERGVRYGFPAQGDIEATLNANTACCATYVAQVLFVSGLLPAEHINKYAYNSCFSGISPMLKDAGWTLVRCKKQ